MKKGRVAVLDKPNGEFIIKEYPLPDPEPGTLLMRIELCGVCGTDVHTYHGYMSDAPFPIILGHEIVGEIIALGKGTKTDFLGKPIKVGDRITLVPAIHCKKCFYCTIAKTPSKCVNMVSYGFFRDPDEKHYFTGGYADYLYLFHPDTDFFKINAPAEVAVFTEPLAIAIHAVDRAHIRLGDTVVVQGSGAIGLLTLICAKLSGAGKTIVVGKRRKERLELAKKLGADLVINMEEVPEEKERIRIVKENSLSGYGADVVFECAGVPQAFSEGIKYLRDSATFCEVGHFADTGSTKINPCTDVLTKNIRIEGIYDNEPEQFVRAIPILEKNEFPFAEIISHKLPLTRLKDAVDAITKGGKIDGKEVVKVVIDPSKG
ncbi:MAG TPA: hypothetical protein ENG47_00355 [Candidatus Aerophobetes bacterium]|uniref:Enoyl reductase (ER) domain-containing protein n=1 Tax=Aerophobetes bacterium TaxID=2030807 RepID=A0A662DL99_UNCAE|nr:MAG: hypothetical protein DRI96_00095 [Candidatus Aerophobetes bacterium]HDN84191.1 hypothetical protein [Candidatus Aerophobetes bacterium]